MKEAYYHIKFTKYTKHTRWNGKKPTDDWIPTTQAEFHTHDKKAILKMVKEQLKTNGKAVQRDLD